MDRSVVGTCGTGPGLAEEPLPRKCRKLGRSPSRLRADRGLKGRGRGGAGSDGAGTAEETEAAKQSEPAAQKQKVVVTTGSVNQGDGKSVLLVCCLCVAHSPPH